MNDITAMYQYQIRTRDDDCAYDAVGRYIKLIEDGGRGMRMLRSVEDTRCYFIEAKSIVMELLRSHGDVIEVVPRP